MRRVLLLVLLVLVTSTLPARADVAEPIAVAPFRNLTGQDALEWLSLGMAETMSADLRKAGHRVVERGQLNQVLRQLALQQAMGAGDDSANGLGKGSAAETLVVGSYQQAGDTLRITARLLALATGQLQHAVTVTGPLADIFALQDRLVAQLFPAKAAPAAERTGASEGTIAAYQLYAQSLRKESDPERAEVLKKALALDPRFTYASSELAALEKRLDAYAQESQRLRQAMEERRRAQLGTEGDPPEVRARKACDLLTSELMGRRYRALLADARTVAQLELPAANGVNVAEFASYAIVLAHASLRELDLALQAGEKHLQAFPTGAYYAAVDATVHAALEEKRKREEGKAQAQEELARLDKERAQVQAEARPQVLPMRLRALEFQRCSQLQRSAQYESALAECRSFADAHAADADEGAKDLVLTARFLRIQALSELGRFAEARAAVQQLDEAEPAFVRRMALKAIQGTWPQE